MRRFRSKRPPADERPPAPPSESQSAPGTDRDLSWTEPEQRAPDRPSRPIAQPDPAVPAESAEAPSPDRVPSSEASRRSDQRRQRREGDKTTMIPARGGRFVLESLFVRIIATSGIVAVGVLVGAILVSQDVQGWIVGLVVATVSVILAAVLWSSRQV